MRALGRDRRGWDEGALHAYHDGRLRGWARWRFERQLGRSPELRRELETLALMRDLIRENEAWTPTPDLWDRIEQRLPAEDARRAEAEAAGRIRGLLPRLLKPAGAVATAAAVAAVVAFALISGETGAVGVVRWMDSGDRNVMVLEDDSEITIIWLLESAPDEARRGLSRGVV